MKKTGCIILAFRNFRYYLKSAASSFVRNGIMTFASFVTVSCCLFLFGVFLLFTANMNYISTQIEAQCEIQAYISKFADDAAQQEAYNAILNLENVSDAKLETKYQAFASFEEMLGERSDLLDGLSPDDFLRSSIKVTLKDIRQSEQTVKAIREISGIEDVKDRQDIVAKVVRFTDVVKRGSAIAMLILMAVAVFIIQNTIKISVFARAREINIMKFVGASDRFIRMPFVFEGIMTGILGFIVSYAVIVFGYNAAITAVKDIINLFDYLPIERCVAPLGAAMALFGTMMGAIGSTISIKRHLKV